MQFRRFHVSGDPFVRVVAQQALVKGGGSG